MPAPGAADHEHAQGQAQRLGAPVSAEAQVQLEQAVGRPGEEETRLDDHERGEGFQLPAMVQKIGVGDQRPVPEIERVADHAREHGGAV